MKLSRWFGLVPALAAVLVRLALTDATGAIGLLLVTATFLGLCGLFGRGLLRLVPIEIPDGVHASASIVLGGALLILLTNFLLLCRAAQITQTIVLVLAVVAVTVLVFRSGEEAPKHRLRDLLPLLAALAAATLPLVVHNAFSGAGNVQPRLCRAIADTWLELVCSADCQKMSRATVRSPRASAAVPLAFSGIYRMACRVRRIIWAVKRTTTTTTESPINSASHGRAPGRAWA